MKPKRPKVKPIRDRDGTPNIAKAYVVDKAIDDEAFVLERKD